MASEERRLADHRHIALDVLNRISALELRARELVEGVMAGLQRSPYLGASSEFAQHRAYVPGDDVRHVDWKVYGRTARYYVRQFQEETNFVVTFVLDSSESMRYGSAGTTKLDHACLLIASLGYLALRQSDAVSLALFDESLVAYLPPRTHLAALGLLAAQLEVARAERGTRLDAAVNVLTRMLDRRGIVVLVSDFLDLDPAGSTSEAGSAVLAQALEQLRYHQHEAIVCQVLDPQEILFEFGGRARFVGLEGAPSATAEPAKIRADYVELVREFLAETKAACAGANADYVLANTTEPVDRLLIRYLTARGKSRKGRK
jgi:uncharacterized protein (DUF58 family)